MKIAWALSQYGGKKAVDRAKAWVLSWFGLPRIPEIEGIQITKDGTRLNATPILRNTGRWNTQELRGHYRLLPKNHISRHCYSYPNEMMDLSPTIRVRYMFHRNRRLHLSYLSLRHLRYSTWINCDLDPFRREQIINPRAHQTTTALDTFVAKKGTRGRIGEEGYV